MTKGNILITQQELQSLGLERHESYFLKVKDANKEILMNVLNATQFYNSTKLPKKLQSLENFSTYFLKSTGFTLNDIFYKTDFAVGDEIKIQKASNGTITTYLACGTNCANGWFNYNNETLSTNDKITIITANPNKKYFKIKNTGNVNIEKCETFIQNKNFYKILNSKTISLIFDSTNNGDTLTFYTQGKLNGTVTTYYTLNGNWLNPNGQIDNTFLIPAGSLFTLDSDISETINIQNNSSVIIQKYINKVYSFNSSTDSVYIYKGGLSNKLIDIFNPANLDSAQDTIQICGKTYLAVGSGWIDPASENTRDDIILKYGDQIILNSQNTLDVNGGAILSKVVDENFNGKIKIYQSENDLIQDTVNFEVFTCNNLYWFDEFENLLKYDYIIPNEAIIVFDCNYSSTINFSSSAKIKKYNRLSIKKQNLGGGTIKTNKNYILNSKFDADNQYPIADANVFFDSNYPFMGNCNDLGVCTILGNNYTHNSPLFYEGGFNNYHTFANRTFHEINAPYDILPIGHPIQPRLLKMFGAGSKFGRADNLTNYLKTITNTTSFSPSDAESWTKYGVEQVLSIPSWATKVVYGVKYLAKSDDLFRENNFAGLKLNFRTSYSDASDRNYVNIHLIRRSTASAVDTLESLYGSNVYLFFDANSSSNAMCQWLGPQVSRVKIRKRSSTIIDSNTNQFIKIEDTIDIPTFSSSGGEPDFGNSRPEFLSLEMFFAEWVSYLNDDLVSSGSIYFYEPFIYFV